MTRFITFKCPCGYVLEERREIKMRTIPSDGLIICIPGQGPVTTKDRKVEDVVVERETVQGDEDYQSISVLTSYNYTSRRGNYKTLLVCPKCGNVLLPEIALKVSESK